MLAVPTRRSRAERRRRRDTSAAWSRASRSISPRRPTAECSCSSRAIATCARSRASCARAASSGGGRCSCTARRRATRCSRRFRESGRAILLGTASFWEGVDVPGDALRGLLIAKLPFRVPTEPVTAAHCEAIEARGGDSFTEYMLPHAALRLKQGFGRLIRTGADRGVVVIGDPRVVHQGVRPRPARGAAAGAPNRSRRGTIVFTRVAAQFYASATASTRCESVPERSSASAATTAITPRRSATRSRRSR